MRSDYIQIIKQICPASDGGAEKIVYSRDASPAVGNAGIIAWPSTYLELQKLVRFCAREKISITARGGGTGLVGGAVPHDAIVVDMSRMNAISNLNHNNKTINAGAGVILDQLNDKLKPYNLEFPVQPGSHAACTIGGMIATNAAGMMSARYGRTADRVLALKIMDGTGKVFDFDKEKIKEIAGTEGNCCIILEATLNLQEIQNDVSSDLFAFETIEEVLEKFEELKNDKSVMSIEYVNELASQLAGIKPREYLLVKYAGKKGKFGEYEAEKFWKLRENLYSVLVESGFGRIEDPKIPEARVKDFLVWLQIRKIPCYGHISSGIFHPHFANEKDLNEMYDLVSSINGDLASEHGVGILKKKLAPAFMYKMKSLKERYDPVNILNRGKIF